MLERYIVTLDAQSERAFFKEYQGGEYTHSDFGFSLAFDNSISIAAVWDGSPAKAAGLQPGMTLTAINGIDTAYTKPGLVRAIKAMSGNEIVLAWKDGSVKLVKQKGD